jgi:hypothetical protein
MSHTTDNDLLTPDEAEFLDHLDQLSPSEKTDLKFQLHELTNEGASNE